MSWLRVIGYPEYFVNERYEAKHKERVLVGAVVTLRRPDRRQISVSKKRLFLLTTIGIDPYLAIGSNVETFEIEGHLRLIDWRERRKLSATRQHQITLADKEFAKKKFNATISWAQSCIDALDGITEPLWSILQNGKSNLDNYLLHQCGERSCIIREEVISETFTTYVERVVNGRTVTCNWRAMKRTARGILAKINNTKYFRNNGL